ncbi:MAG: S-layer homology domain-containing protein [Oscillospiraceae bacterium]|nr:S-layer homology domain-containing protein [Oscillospiraceae bacterium]
MSKTIRGAKILIVLLLSLAMALSIGWGIFGSRLVARADEDELDGESQEELAEPEDSENSEDEEEVEGDGEEWEPISGSLVFNDVVADAWFYDAVMYVYDNDVMQGSYIEGVEEPKFDPEASFTRAQAAMIFYRLAQEPDVSDLSNPFSDVVAGAWYTDAIIWAADDGIVEGYPGNLFGPNDAITREQLATIVNRWLDGRTLPNIVDYEWPDFDTVRDYAQEHVLALTAIGVFEGIPGDNFRPGDDATRAEIASVLFKLLSAIDEAGDSAEVDVEVEGVEGEVA